MTPLQTRIIDLLQQQPTRRMDYHSLMGSLWPRDLHPKAWRYSRNGGPPGCAMPFGRALNKMHTAGVLFVDYHDFGREIILQAAYANAELTGARRASELNAVLCPDCGAE